jgi:hypothetical protein
MLSKKETHVPEIRDAYCVGTSPFSLDMRRVLCGHVSLFLHQKLNNCYIKYSVYQKLNRRLQKQPIFSHIEHISHQYPLKVKFLHKWPYFHTLSIFHTNILWKSIFHTLSIFHTNIQWKSIFYTNCHIEHISHKYSMKVKFSHIEPILHNHFATF